MENHSRLESYEIRCLIDNVIVHISRQRGEVYSNVSQCDICGSHGTTELSFVCESCGKSHTILLAEW